MRTRMCGIYIRCLDSLRIAEIIIKIYLYNVVDVCVVMIKTRFDSSVNTAIVVRFYYI